ncbi:NADPH-dependent 7-cyano-7-deazaguanine reductase QueF [Endozoicomonas sp. (ex Bugula neritina AB1)]|nr:NADPH-dependent 7-cyano-7-deazaguanine reductase QueF [Endozoicomonas sp. (ex Bugula neritina AB1)]
MTVVIETSPLGKSCQYKAEYAPELLFPLPRKEKRDELGITESQLPFHGRDLWYGYELSWLGPKGKPEVRIAQFEIPCESRCLIESKSFKLYLNSFNQTRFDDAVAVKHCLEKDLSEATEAKVLVTLFTLPEFEQLGIQSVPGICIDEQDVEVTTYQYNPDLLASREGQITETLCSHLLKSNCLVTGQPDWGTLVISYQGEAIDHGSLLQYICSFRQHQEFHEQCVERIYSDLQKRFKLSSLTVYAQYVRRGGLDINPWRSSESKSPEALRFVRQ